MSQRQSLRHSGYVVHRIGKEMHLAAAKIHEEEKKSGLRGRRKKAKTKKNKKIVA